MAQRSATISRDTLETQISVSVNLDGSGTATPASGIAFLDHMLEQVGRHGMLDLEVAASGDLHVDAHHTVEDVGICLGQAIHKALGDRHGITRYGHAYVPLDEALSRVVIDFSGRPGLEYNVHLARPRVGDFDVDLVHEFFQGFVNHAQATLHIDVIRGRNAHHIIETMFKAFGRALRMAVSPDPRSAAVPSTKGSLQPVSARSIAVVDYGMGNLRSVSKALEHVAGRRASVRVTSDPAVVARADHVVVPGQGAAADCMRSLAAVHMLDSIGEALRAKPFLGICMGLQLLFDRSDENEGTACLGACAGQVLAFPAGQRDARGQRLKVPHMGWNRVNRRREHPLLDGIEDHARFYFVHSYYVEPASAALTLATTEHGLSFTCAVAWDNVFACQFHPEKSAVDGLRLLENFVGWDGTC